MIVLDTQHVSQLQRTGSADAVRLEARLRPLPIGDVRITVVTPFEQLRACLGAINSAREPDALVRSFDLLLRLIGNYSTKWAGRIFPYDRAAAAIYGGFASALIRRIGPMDARIAAIALAHSATLLTANLSDFRLVPGLVVEDWLRA